MSPSCAVSPSELPSRVLVTLVYHPLIEVRPRLGHVWLCVAGQSPGVLPMTPHLPLIRGMTCLCLRSRSHSTVV